MQFPTLNEEKIDISNIEVLHSGFSAVSRRLGGGGGLGETDKNSEMCALFSWGEGVMTYQGGAKKCLQWD